MARILPGNVNADFIKAYSVDGLGDCDPASLTIKVWDLYGTAPKDGEAVTAEGTYIAAVVYCEGCDKNVEVHREQLGS